MLYSIRVIQLDIPAVVEVLTRQLVHNSMATRIAALRWIFHLFTKTPNKASDIHHKTWNNAGNQ